MPHGIGKILQVHNHDHSIYGAGTYVLVQVDGWWPEVGEEVEVSYRHGCGEHGSRHIVEHDGGAVCMACARDGSPELLSEKE